MVLLATLCAIVLRTDLNLPSPDFVRYIPYLGTTAAIAFTAIAVSGIDRGFWRFASLHDVITVICVAAIIAISTPTIIFAYNRLEGIARTIPIIQLLLIAVFLLTPQLVARYMSRVKRRAQLFDPPPVDDPATQTALIVGITVMAELYLTSLAEVDDRTLRVVGVVGTRADDVGRFMNRYPILGTIDDIDHVMSDLVVHGVTVNRIVVAVPLSSLSPKVRDLLHRLRDQRGIVLDTLAHRISGVGLAGGGFNGSGLALGILGAGETREIGTRQGAAAKARLAHPGEGIASGLHLLAIPGPDLELLAASPYWRIKRVIDVVGAGLLIVILLPIGVLAAAMVAIDVGFPLIFWQERLGVGGATFRIYKLRTMAAARDRRGSRIADAERLSVIGAMLRRSRLDELPQLWNVIIGDMSLIGPRPLLPVDQPGRSGRLVVRPGLTGWAQVQGGRAITPVDKAALDVWFIRNACFTLDARIVLSTLRLLIFGERVNQAAIDLAWGQDVAADAPR